MHPNFHKHGLSSSGLLFQCSDTVFHLRKSLCKYLAMLPLLDFLRVSATLGE